MKTLLLTVIVAIGFVSASCGVTKSQTNSQSPREQTPVTKQTVTVLPPPANADEYKNLLFVDQRLEELITRHDLPNDPFAKAYQHVKEGKTDDAKKSLRQVLSDPSTQWCLGESSVECLSLERQFHQWVTQRFESLIRMINSAATFR